jgi:hypothetical protein
MLLGAPVETAVDGGADDGVGTRSVGILTSPSTGVELGVGAGAGTAVLSGWFRFRSLSKIV